MSDVDGLVADYLSRLERAAAALPPDRRHELVEELRAHIASAAPADEAEVRTLLDRLGEPEEIAAVAHEDLPGAAQGWGPPPMVPVPRGTGQELAAVLLLTVGSLLPLVGWVLGVVLLWSSPLWRRREKLLGTLVVPFGPGGAYYLLAFLPLLSGGTEQSCVTVSGNDGGSDGGEVSCTVSGTGVGLPGWLGLLLLLVVVVAPVLVAVLLMRTARRRAQEQPVLVPQYGLPRAPSAWGGLEVAAVVVLAFGGVVVPFVGPLVGLGLVLASARWTRGEKLVAAVLSLLPLLALLALFAVRGGEGGVL